MAIAKTRSHGSNVEFAVIVVICGFTKIASTWDFSPSWHIPQQTSRGCCRCNHPNFDRNLFHSFEIETTNNFDNLNFSGSVNVNSPNSDFDPTQHSSPIPPFRPKNRPRNWRTLLINCRSLKGEVAIFLASPNYYQPDCILGTESWLDKDTTTSEIFPPEYQVLRKDRNSKARGGGVFIAVRKPYDMTPLPDLETNCEILWAKVYGWYILSCEKGLGLRLRSFSQLKM